MAAMLSSGAVTAVVILQLVLSFIAVFLAAFSAVCFGAEFGYGVVWWSFGWILVVCCLRWWTHDLRRSVVQQMVHLAFEVFTLLDWLVATGVLIALNIHLHKLSKEYAFDTHHKIQITDELVPFQFTILGVGGLYCSYALNAVAGIIFILLLLSTLNSIRLLRFLRRATKADFDHKYNHDNLSTQEQILQKIASPHI